MESTLAGGYCYTKAEVIYAKTRQRRNSDSESASYSGSKSRNVNVIFKRCKKMQNEKFEVFVCVDEESDDFNL